MTRLLLVRHGQTEWNCQQRYQGQSDVPLDATGQRQVVQLARRLSREPIDAIFSSVLKRAAATARHIAAYHRLDVQHDPRLRELHFGAFEGLTYAEVKSTYPQDLAAWEADRNQAPPGGESLASLVDRLTAFLAETRAAYPAGNLLVVGHGGPLRVLLCLLLGLPPEKHWQFQLDTASWTEIHVYDTGAILAHLNTKDGQVNLPVIPPLDSDAQQTARSRQVRLTKPNGALGKLEDLSVRLAGMTGNLTWLPERRTVLVFAGDHGVVAQGISTYPQDVTRQMVLNFLNGGAAINVLARQTNTRVTVVDAGVIGDFEAHPDLIAGKVAPGTADFSQGPAMSAQQAEQSIQLGLDAVRQEIARGLDILAVGEMGIGNTTAASAIIAAVTGAAPAEVTGRGTGLDDQSLAHKIAVIDRALRVNQPADQDTLMKVGGFEIGAMAGAIIGAAAERIPVIIDGLISTAAALIAAQIDPATKPFLIAGHRSAEPGHIAALEALGLEPLLDLNMRLGEGSGAVLAIPIIEAAMRTLQEMATFDSASVSGPA
ncbi:MAG: nicotinate-nucleotide--dimethylbenzimidazole phosphoribosyltransferase [Chloroflexi bacterium]|nr:nicotinate-nucleotide--dimethylbenzimidazole phosphoribosyltransferase [Chloroflexota bacterium]